MEEEWRDIKDYEGIYQVSNYGRVRSCTRIITYKNGSKHHKQGKILTLVPNSDGYMLVGLNVLNKQKTRLVHRLVAETFLEKIKGKNEINHIDENKKNNSVSNLEWVNRKENCNHGTRNKRISERNRAAHPGKQIAQYTIAGELVATYPKIKEAARCLGVNCISISCALNGKNKTAYGYVWKFL
ncbi:HNH homing endonuclease [Streptococcus phage Javan220]|nr:HNH homing endonuclease [Streptococcus phage Javan220]SFR59849.1 HNH endonuclease [Streptococcus equinus]